MAMMGPLCQQNALSTTLICDQSAMEQISNPPNTFSSSPQSSYPSISSEGELNAQSPNVRKPNSSSGYSSENPALETEKQQKKKRIQECLREIKNLLSQQTQSTSHQENPQKLETVEALSRVLELLRGKAKTEFEEAGKSENSQDTLTEQKISNPDILASYSAIFDTDIHDTNDLFLGTFNISLPDGAVTGVTYLTPQLCNGNQYQADFQESFIGVPLLDLVAETDRYLLASCVFRPTSIKPAKHSLFARLNKNRISTADSCQLMCEIVSDELAKVSFSRLVTSFTEPKQKLSLSNFCTRHSTNGRFTFIDSSAVHYCGYLPQDLLGHSIFAFFHQDDISTICYAHEQLMAAKIPLVKTKPCRFMCQNGDFVIIETEWSLFLNPWTHKVEFVIGYHRILEGPQYNLNVFVQTEQMAQNENLLSAIEIAQVENQLANVCSQVVLGKSTKTPKSAKMSKTTETTSSKGVSKPSTNVEYRPLNYTYSAAQTTGTLMAKRRDLCAYVDNIVENMVLSGNATKPPAANNAPLNLATRSQVFGDGESSGSPPASSGQLSYTQINCLENVQRLLKSEPRTHASNADSNSPQKSPTHENKSNSTSPLEDAQRIMHRCHSAYELEPMPLTRELLQQHTKKWENEYKETWKRRYSEGYNPHMDYSSLKRALETNNYGQEDLVYPQKMLRMDFHRPASMPLLAKSLQDPSGIWSGFLPVKGTDYYRALGPNPPPPPGRNFQITSAPLPTGLGTVAEPPFATPVPSSPPARRSAFAPPKKSTDPTGVNWNQPINLSYQDPRTQAQCVPNQPQRSVIRPSPLVQQLSTVHSQPDSSSSNASLQRDYSDWQSARSRDMPWMGGVPLTEDLVLRYQQVPDNPAQILARDHQRLIAMNQPNIINQQLEKVYSELQSAQISQPLEQSPVKEATDALMLLQET